MEKETGIIYIYKHELHTFEMTTDVWKLSVSVLSLYYCLSMEVATSKIGISEKLKAPIHNNKPDSCIILIYK